MIRKISSSISFLFINGITIYRLVATLLLLYFIISNELLLFKWFLAFSFFTDAIDGFLARKFKVVSVFGSRMDSIADDLTVVVAMVGLFYFQYEFLAQYYIHLIVLFSLYFLQVLCALIRYHKFTSFHTWFAKFSFLLQGLFFIGIFFLPQPPVLLFYGALIFTAIEIIEEIILVLMLRTWQTDVKGIYWVLKNRKKYGI